MGLKNASYTMQRLIDRILRGAQRFAGALLDDRIVYDNNFQLHLEHVRDILDRLRAAGLTANGSKCTLGASTIRIRGHIVQYGAKTAVIANWPVPRSKKRLKSFLGLTSYFRNFIRSYADIAYHERRVTGCGLWNINAKRRQ